MKRICITITIILLSFKLLFAPSISKYQSEQKEANMKRIIRLNELMNARFSPENLFALLIVLEVPDPVMIFNQAKLETGHFTSRAFKEGSNCFGMHKAVVRRTTSIGYIIADRNRRVAKYATWQDSVFDLVLYFEYYESLGYNLKNYEKFLVDAGYCESKDYIQLLKNM